MYTETDIELLVLGPVYSQTSKNVQIKVQQNILKIGWYDPTKRSARGLRKQ